MIHHNCYYNYNNWANGYMKRVQANHKTETLISTENNKYIYMANSSIHMT